MSVVSRVLENMSFEVKGVKNGKELLKTLEKTEADLILMDINMPQMDGLTCTDHIRNNENEKIRNIPIIALSGNAKNLTVEEYKEKGINDLIQKPIDFDQMAKKIHNFLS